MTKLKTRPIKVKDQSFIWMFDELNLILNLLKFRTVELIRFKVDYNQWNLKK